MTKAELLESAKKITQPTIKTAEEFSQKRDHLVTQINQVMAGRKDLKQLIGEGNEQMMEDNHNNHAQFMETVFYSYSPEVLVETVLWVFRAYHSHGFQLTYWPAQLSTWNRVLQETLSPNSAKEILFFYQWMMIHVPVFTRLSESWEGSEALDPASKH
ncbi:MAG: hypothetical protein HQM14_08485 [SAR324 cluster bacterium]|nr:hypothetical protein [SAR324 cluster bacterium]